MIEKLGIRLYDQHEATSMLGVSIQTLRAMCRDGRLTKTRLGASVYIPENSLRAYLNGTPFQNQMIHESE